MKSFKLWEELRICRETQGEGRGHAGPAQKGPLLGGGGACCSICHTIALVSKMYISGISRPVKGLALIDRSLWLFLEHSGINRKFRDEAESVEWVRKQTGLESKYSHSNSQEPSALTGQVLLMLLLVVILQVCYLLLHRSSSSSSLFGVNGGW